MKKTLLIVLLPVVLMVAGAFGVWANEQSAVKPGCGKCVTMEKAAPCGNCPKAANQEKGSAPCANCPQAMNLEQGAAPCGNCPNAAQMEKCKPCGNCPNAANMEKGKPCGNCPNAARMEQGCGNCAKMKGAAAAPASGTADCDKCAKLQPAQPASKGCCNKQSQPL